MDPLLQRAMSLLSRMRRELATKPPPRRAALLMREIRLVEIHLRVLRALEAREVREPRGKAALGSAANRAL